MSRTKVSAPQSSKSQEQVADSKQSLQASQVRSVAALGTQGSGSPLPFLSRLQHSFGRHDLSGIRSFVGSSARDATQTLGARGFTIGNRIAFDSANPSLHVVAHEAAHVIQQQSGVQLSQGIGESGDAYEQQAEQIAHAVVRGESVQSQLDQITSSCSNQQGSPSSSCIQFYTEEKDLDDQKSLTYNVTRYVSQNSEMMCYGHGKDALYATKDKIDESNQALEAAGSFVRLADPNAIQLPEKSRQYQDDSGQTVTKHLFKCFPQWNSKDNKLLGMHGVEHSNLNEANVNSNLENSKLYSSQGWKHMKLWHDCGKSSSAIMGSASGTREAVYKSIGSNNDQLSVTGRNAHPVSFRNEIHQNSIEKFLKANPLYINEEIHQPVYSKMNRITYFKGMKNAKQYVDAYYAMSPEGQKAYDEAVLINRSVFPEVGEGYAMITDPSSKDWKKGNNQFQFHWAGVIAKDGPDRVALEAEASSLDPWTFDENRWNFEMYGPQKGQTFHDKHLATGSHGDRATTVRVRVPSNLVNSQWDIYQDEGKLNEKQVSMILGLSGVKQESVQNIRTPAPIPRSMSMMNLDSHAVLPIVPPLLAAPPLRLNQQNKPPSQIQSSANSLRQPPLLSRFNHQHASSNFQSQSSFLSLSNSNLSSQSLFQDEKDDKQNSSVQPLVVNQSENDSRVYRGADGHWYEEYLDVNKNTQTRRINPPEQQNNNNNNVIQHQPSQQSLVLNNNQVNVAPVPKVIAPVPQIVPSLNNNQVNVAPVPKVVAPPPKIIAPMPKIIAPLPQVIQNNHNAPSNHSVLDDTSNQPIISSTLDDKPNQPIISSVLDDKPNLPIISSVLDDKKDELSHEDNGVLQSNLQSQKPSSPPKKITPPSLRQMGHRMTQYDLYNDADMRSIRAAANAAGLSYFPFRLYSVSYLLRLGAQNGLSREFGISQEKARLFYIELQKRNQHM